MKIYMLMKEIYTFLKKILYLIHCAAPSSPHTYQSVRGCSQVLSVGLLQPVSTACALISSDITKVNRFALMFLARLFPRKRVTVKRVFTFKFLVAFFNKHIKYFFHFVRTLVWLSELYTQIQTKIINITLKRPVLKRSLQLSQ